MFREDGSLYMRGRVLDRESLWRQTISTMPLVKNPVHSLGRATNSTPSVESRPLSKRIVESLGLVLIMYSEFLLSGF